MIYISNVFPIIYTIYQGSMYHISGDTGQLYFVVDWMMSWADVSRPFPQEMMQEKAIANKGNLDIIPRNNLTPI